jgi:hypothetical protein
MVDAKKIHCKHRFGIMKMYAGILGDLNMYLVVDQRHMKVIDAHYNARVGY